MNDEKPKGKPEYPCPMCGSTDFEWGVAGEGSPRMRFVQREHIGVFGGQFAPYYDVEARHCLTCRNVQLFTENEYRRD